MRICIKSHEIQCCLQRRGISRLPEVAGDKPAKQSFKAYPIGYLAARCRLRFV